VVVPNSRITCVFAPLRLCVGSTAFSRVKGLGLDRRVADDAVALADGVVEAGQLLAARGGLDPEAELADFDLDKLAAQSHHQAKAESRKQK
jgi:hypothetical protein